MMYYHSDNDDHTKIEYILYNSGRIRSLVICENKKKLYVMSIPLVIH